MGLLKFKRNPLKRLLFLGTRKKLDGEVSDCEIAATTSSSSSSSSSSSLCVDPLAQRPKWKCFLFEEIYMATNGFHQDNLVGRGGYAEVYRGLLDNGQTVAVKKLTSVASNGQKETDFLSELGTIAHVRHPNVCALLGCCIDNDLHLIFEFSSNGSVSSHLHDESLPPISWKLRYKIAVGTALGLQYLHKGCQRRIIHRDIKTSNILLTADFEPQISDFGLARWLPTDWSHRNVDAIEGTFGYLAPEYFKRGIVDEKTDVFAFGVFLLEIISGRKPVDGSHQSLLAWARPHLNHGAVEMLVDPKLGQEYDPEHLNKLIFVASLCIRAAARWRPSMTEIVELLGDGEILKERWKLQEEDEDEGFWGLEELEDEEDFDDNDGFDTSFSSVSSSGSS